MLGDQDHIRGLFAKTGLMQTLGELRMRDTAN